MYLVNQWPSLERATQKSYFRGYNRDPKQTVITVWGLGTEGIHQPTMQHTSPSDFTTTVCGQYNQLNSSFLCAANPFVRQQLAVVLSSHWSVLLPRFCFYLLAKKLCRGKPIYLLILVKQLDALYVFWINSLA